MSPCVVFSIHTDSNPTQASLHPTIIFTYQATLEEALESHRELLARTRQQHVLFVSEFERQVFPLIIRDAVQSWPPTNQSNH